MLLDILPRDPLGDPSTTVKVRACTSDETEAAEPDSNNSSTLFRRDGVDSTSLCVSDLSSSTVSLDMSTSGQASDYTWATVDALALISNSLSSSCDLKQIYSYSTGSIVGVFSGASIDNGGTVPSIMAEVIAYVNVRIFASNNSMVSSPDGPLYGPEPATQALSCCPCETTTLSYTRLLIQ